MAFIQANFRRLGPASNDPFAIWLYKTTDIITDVDTVGYFNAVSSMVTVGDWIIAQVNSAVAPNLVSYVVFQNAAGIADVGTGVNLGISTADID